MTSHVSRNALFAFAVAFSLYGGLGCELIASPDRSKIPDGNGGGTTTGGGGAGPGGSGGAAGHGGTGGTGGIGGTGGTGGVGGTGGSGGSGGSGGQGGTGGTGGTGGVGGTGGTGGSGGQGGTGGAECMFGNDCPDPGTVCILAICTAGTCGTQLANAGKPVPDASGNCQKKECDGAGAEVTSNDDTDILDDGNDCTTDGCSAGVGTHIPVSPGTACGLGGTLVCNAAGQCVGCNLPSDCAGQDTECQTRTCTAGVCGVDNAPAGTPLAAQTDGNCQHAECDGNGAATTVDDNADVPVDGNPCTGDVCTAGVPSNPPLTGPVCNDANACTQTDTCQAGACTGSNPVVCAALDQCHDVGTCNSATGVCSNPAKANGSACSDGNACTQTDTCQAGTCTGANPVVCTPLDQCHTAGACDTGTGVCSNPVKSDGSTCSDGNACTQTDTCQAGACTGANPVVCTPLDQCHDAGTCDTGTGACSNPAKADGAGCTDGNACTSGDTCQGGACAGGGSVTCTPLDECHDAGICDPGTGCSNPAKADGTVCSVGQCVGGICTPPPTVIDTAPADGAGSVAVTTTVAVTFSAAMNPATLTAKTTSDMGACSGSIQLSTDNFATCIGFAGAPAMSGGNTVATLAPSPALSFGTTYRLKVTVAALSQTGMPLAAEFTHATGFATATDGVAGPGVVISQVYGAGGNSGATFNADFVELHNRGTTVASIGGWSIQYAAQGSNFGNATLKATLPAVVDLQPGQYYLVQMSTVGANGAALTPDFTAAPAVALAATAGKVALVNTATTLPAQPCVIGDPSVVDLVGYGTLGVACWETLPGAGAAPAPSTTNSVTRKGGGCFDSADNSADFVAAPASPHNTASTAFVCSVSVNEKNVAAELDFCNVQFPTSIAVQTGALTPTIYAQAYEAGITDPAGPAANLVAQIGYGPTTANPESQAGWTWTPAAFNTNVGNNDEWQAQLTAPAVGTYLYGARFSFDGIQWTYCDLDGAGSNSGLGLVAGALPVMTVTP